MAYLQTGYFAGGYLPPGYFADNGFTGYKLYRGVGGLGEVDFDTPVAEFVSSAEAGSVIGAGHAANTRYTYVLRAVIDDLETPDYSCRCEFVTDSEGDWTGLRPAPVEFVNAEVKAAGVISVSWSYQTPYGQTAPEDFCVYHSTTPVISIGSPDATEDYTADCLYSEDLSLVDGTSYYLAVTARTAGGVESELSEVIGPFLADATAPPTPAPTITVSF